jgi:hypothetical protein
MQPQERQSALSTNRNLRVAASLQVASLHGLTDAYGLFQLTAATRPMASHSSIRVSDCRSLP